VILPDFEYSRRGSERLEIPLAERIAAIRSRKAEDRARAKTNAARRGQHQPPQGQRPGATPRSSGGPARPVQSWPGKPSGPRGHGAR